IENLNDRIRAWWVMVLFLSLAFIGGRTGVILLFALCSFAALREFITLTQAKSADHWSLVGAFFIVLPVQYYLIWIGWYGLYAIFI
ncbi:phosphatidate cytidylyltransferase, partial [Bacillus cereus group sp. BC306]|uniref:phosphatidate cytidylyltransferase n=1 Tax=Bacillus cereus group sp. BC306 TaxID=3445320 RepID=UPI003F23351A